MKDQDINLDKLKNEIANRYKGASYFELLPILHAIDMAYCLGVDKAQVRKSKRVVRDDGKKFDSIAQAARNSKVNEKSIRRALKSGNLSAGYKWKHAS